MVVTAAVRGQRAGRELVSSETRLRQAVPVEPSSEIGHSRDDRLAVNSESSREQAVPVLVISETSHGQDGRVTVTSEISRRRVVPVPVISATSHLLVALLVALVAVTSETGFSRDAPAVVSRVTRVRRTGWAVISRRTGRP